MTLLITILAAIVSTLLWYTSERARYLKISTLCYMYWGASLMWLVDAIFEYSELRDAYFTPALSDMINDSFLGLCVCTLALLVWVAVILIKDPNHILRKSNN